MVIATFADELPTPVGVKLQHVTSPQVPKEPLASDVHGAKKVENRLWQTFHDGHWLSLFRRRLVVGGRSDSLRSSRVDAVMVHM